MNLMNSMDAMQLSELMALKGNAMLEVNVERAIRLYSNAIEIFPENYYTYQLLADALETKGCYNDAVNARVKSLDRYLQEKRDTKSKTYCMLLKNICETARVCLAVRDELRVLDELLAKYDEPELVYRKALFSAMDGNFEEATSMLEHIGPFNDHLQEYIRQYDMMLLYCGMSQFQKARTIARNISSSQDDVTNIEQNISIIENCDTGAMTREEYVMCLFKMDISLSKKYPKHNTSKHSDFDGDSKLFSRIIDIIMPKDFDF
jgi:tetratricopeptide (TPR) repeat protein